MKTFMTLAAVAALAGGLAVANAQTSPSPNKQEPSPAAINGGGTKTGVQAGSTSGEMSGSAMKDKDNMKKGSSASMKKHSTTGSGYDSESRGSPMYGPDHTKLPNSK